MHVQIRPVLATGKILKVLLPVVVWIAMVTPGGDVGYGQRPPGSQVPPFTAIDLNPSEVGFSVAHGIFGEQQVGESNPASIGDNHALLWRGSAGSVVDLHPSGYHHSRAAATCGGQQVGAGGWHALLWRGSAASVVDLHPSEFEFSEAFGTSGGQQVGYGSGPATGDHDHALLWRGSAASVVDLHPSGFEKSEAHGTSGGQQVGYGSGPVTGGDDHALLWRGSAASVVDLHPRGFTRSRALGTDGEQQVGVGDGHALLWRGSAASVVDLHPSGFEISEAFGTSGGQQVGWGYRPGMDGPHALLWRGSAASVVDLHVYLPPDFARSNADGIDATGDIVGEARSKDVGYGMPVYNLVHAFLWKRNAPTSGAPRGQNTMGCENRP